MPRHYNIRPVVPSTLAFFAEPTIFSHQMRHLHLRFSLNVLLFALMLQCSNELGRFAIPIMRQANVQSTTG